MQQIFALLIFYKMYVLCFKNTFLEPNKDEHFSICLLIT